MVCGIVLARSATTLGSVVLIVGHGLISSALFYLARLRYNQRSTRRLFYALGLTQANHNLIWWLFLSLANARLPPFLLFLGEILIFKVILFYPPLVFLFFLNYCLIGYYNCLL